MIVWVGFFRLIFHKTSNKTIPNENAKEKQLTATQFRDK